MRSFSAAVLVFLLSMNSSFAGGILCYLQDDVEKIGKLYSNGDIAKLTETAVRLDANVKRVLDEGLLASEIRAERAEVAKPYLVAVHSNVKAVAVILKNANKNLTIEEERILNSKILALEIKWELFRRAYLGE